MNDLSSHKFGEAYRAVYVHFKHSPGTLEFAQQVIDWAERYRKESKEWEDHEQTKETTYIKYP